MGSIQIPTLDTTNFNSFHSRVWKKEWSTSHKPFMFHISRLENWLDQLSFPLRPHRKVVSDFVFLTKGYSRRCKGSKEYDFSDNQFFFNPAYQITSHEYVSEDAEGYYVHFHANIFNNLPHYHVTDEFQFLASSANPIVTIPQEKSTPLLEILKRLEELYLEFDKDDFELAARYVVTLMTEVTQFVSHEMIDVKNSAEYITKQFKNALMQPINQKRTIREYADHLSVTPNHLNKCVKVTLNKTAKDLLQEALIWEAKSLLKNSNLTVSQIADQLCDQTPSNFVRLFKSHTGLTPKEYLNSANTAS